MPDSKSAAAELRARNRTTATQKTRQRMRGMFERRTFKKEEQRGARGQHGVMGGGGGRVRWAKREREIARGTSRTSPRRPAAGRCCCRRSPCGAFGGAPQAERCGGQKGRHAATIQNAKTQLWIDASEDIFHSDLTRVRVWVCRGNNNQAHTLPLLPPFFSLSLPPSAATLFLTAECAAGSALPALGGCAVQPFPTAAASPTRSSRPSIRRKPGASSRWRRP